VELKFKSSRKANHFRHLLIGSFLFFLSSTGFSQLTVPYFAEYESFADIEPLLFADNDTTYVINFWATWCKPCIRELPVFEELHQLTVDKPIKVLLINLDMKRNLDTKLVNFLNRNTISSAVLALTDVDGNSWIPKIDVNWSGAIPATLIRKGNHSVFIEEEVHHVDDLMTLVKQVGNRSLNQQIKK
jgi:thiol-disulfide isomerase/thioredoxin